MSVMRMIVLVGVFVSVVSLLSMLCIIGVFVNM